MITFSRFGSIGRLGNQLFQAAFLTFFAETHQLDYALPTWRYAKYFGYEFKMRDDLDQLSFDLNVAEPFPGYQQNHFERFLPWMRKGRVNIRMGFFQSYKYFTKAHARKIFSPAKAGTLIVNPERSVAISVRRGNFVCHPYFNNIEAETFLQVLDRNFPQYKVFVFTDDYAYCRQNFSGPQFEFFDGCSDIEQLQLMGQFDNFVLSNSTFSYWGPMLSAKPRRVFYPKFIFPDGKMCDLYNREYWPSEPAYIGYDNPINKPPTDLSDTFQKKMLSANHNAVSNDEL